MKRFTVSRFRGFALVAVLVIGCQATETGPSGVASTSGPSPSPSVQPTFLPSPPLVATASPAAGPSLDPSDTSAWLPFVSERYGFSIAYPQGWEAHEAIGQWTFPRDTAWPEGVDRTDWFYLDGPDGSVAASAWSVTLEPGTTADEWFLAYCTIEVTPCEAADAKSPASLDGLAGWFVAGSDPQAYVGIGDRIYLVVVWQPADVPALTPYGGGRTLVEAFLSTMRLVAPGPTQ
jgi:hypothetical protein